MPEPARAPQREAVLRADRVDLVRDGRLLLGQISLTVLPGEHWALLGPNGAGKSTLLRLLGSYAHPTRGTLDLLGSRLGRVDVFTLRPAIALVSPHHPVQSWRTVHQVVLTGATGTLDTKARWTPSAAELDRADLVIKLLGLARLAASRWAVLSHGERSRALIARALMAQPRLLLLDEPSAGLDVAGREQLLASLDELRAELPDLATMLVTHHLEELPASTTHALLLRDGAVVAAGPAEQVLTSALVSRCFDYPLTITRSGRRWLTTAGLPSAAV